VLLFTEHCHFVGDHTGADGLEADILRCPESGRRRHNEVKLSSRYVILLHLPHGRTAEDVRAALTRQVCKLPAELRRTLTWDQGKEMAEHVRFSTDTKMVVYFCDPHSPWQRGTSENTNGLLRKYFPRTSDLSVYSAAQLNAVARELNGRPRQTLNWMKPSEVFSRTVASID